MVETKTIKVSKETYAELSGIAGELQVKLKRPVSLDEAIKHLARRKKRVTKISDLAGSWDVSDQEAKEIEEAIEGSWEKWSLPK
ncbi:MAG: hypothetical protein NWF04_09275 [Candidatus Bathyarchaeota archaeon]|nr:hypothetical protein [Candidatus Bathyarchaeota archaeon]